MITQESVYLPTKKKPTKKFSISNNIIGLKIIRLKANPIYLIFKSCDIREAQGKGGSRLWNVWKRLAMLAVEGSGTGLHPPVCNLCMQL